MKNIIRLSLVLLMLCSFVTTNESNAAMQSQQDNKSASVKHDYLPDYTVNTMDSEKPVLLAKRWGHYKRRHVCFDRRGPAKFTYKSKWCRTKRMKKAQRARKHYRRTVVAYHKRKQMVRKRPICRVGKRLLNEKGLKRKNRRCNIRPPWRSRHAGKMGNYGCGNPNRKTHVNCLRRLLDKTPHGLTVPKGRRGLGKYGCGTPNRRKHVNCLRRLLDQHGPQFAKGRRRG